MALLRKTIPLAAAAALALPAASPARPARVAAPPLVKFDPGVAGQNFTEAHRATSQIHYIVIHVTEGSFWGTVEWLRNPAAAASANYVVSRGGKIAQLVPLHDIAWHAGNWVMNMRSVGIEHEGVTADPTGFSDPEYRASARLTAYLARRLLLPIDRKHIIGHSDVPDPTDPSAGGGIDNHTDPGHYWRWQHYLKLVRSYASVATPPPIVRLHVASSTLYRGQVVRGTVPWRARISGPVRHVDFLVDGHLRARDTRAPYAYAWRTRGLANGEHLLELRAYGRSSWTRTRFVVRVRNVGFDLALAGVKSGGVVAGVVHPEGVIKGAPASRVELVVDGRVVDHDTTAPFVFTWDTRRSADGQHTLLVRARSADGRTARETAKLTVLNPTPPEIVDQTLVNGQTVSGTVQWRATVRGGVALVEFVVDGVVSASTSRAPFAWSWDTTQETPGPHTVAVRAIGRDGTTVDSTRTVVVSR